MYNRGRPETIGLWEEASGKALAF